MKRYTSALLITILSLGAVWLPLVAGASNDPLFTGKTRMVEQAPSVGEFDGSLQIRIDHEGIISGYYRPDDNPRFVSVTGAVTGDRLWLEIGSRSSRGWRFSGTLRNGAITAYSNGILLDGGRFTGVNLTGTLVPSQ